MAVCATVGAVLGLGCGSPRISPVSAPSADAAPAPVADLPDTAVIGSPEDAFFVPPSGDAPAPQVTSPCAGTAKAAPANCAAVGVTVDPYYAPRYTCFDLGPVPGVPRTKYGGITLTPERCSTTLLIGGDANQQTGKLYAAPVSRDSDGHISGFTQLATVRADAPFNDGGITFGPNQVLFFTRWPSNQLQQTKTGSAIADKVIDLGPLGVASASASLAFVPAGFSSAGALKLVSWGGGQWYTVAFHPDGDTFAIDSARQELTLPGGPEGFVYVASGSPLFEAPSILVSEWTSNSIATYHVDDQGNPVISTRRPFIAGLGGAEGAYRDPATGDFFFSTWGQSVDRVIVVHGFAPIVE